MKKGFSIKNMSAKGKITMFSAVMLLFMIVIACTGLYSANEINRKRSERYDNYGMGEYYLSEAFSNFCNIKVRVRNIVFLYYNDPTNLQDQKTKINNYTNATRQYLQLFEDRMKHFSSEIQKQYQVVEDAIEEWLSSTNADISLAENGKAAEAVEDLMNNGRVIADTAEAELSTLMDMLQSASAQDNETVKTELAALTGILIAVSVIAVIITFGYAALLIRLITIPVAKLSEAAKKLAVGDVDVDCTKLAEDDLGILMDNFSNVVNATREQARIANEIASGDMTVNVAPRSDKDLLGMALQKLVADQNQTLGSVKESTMQVTIGAQQVASASQALAQGSTEQASALEQVTASINEIAENTRKNASEATTANNLVSTVSNMAEDGKEQMQSMVAAMHDISQSSETISKIIKTIDDIAFQTNILALNAAVEAARAGVHGKGFAVVAEEVRNLAAKSASAAKETAEMIEDSICKVGNGQKLADETAEALDKMVSSISEVTVLIGSIASSSNDQATAVTQIDQAINQVSTVVQTNSATSEECAAASEELSNQAVNLRNQMAGYKLLGGDQSGADSMGEKTYSYTSGSHRNEQIISLDGEFGKY